MHNAEQHHNWTIVFVEGVFMQTSFTGVDVSKLELVMQLLKPSDWGKSFQGMLVCSTNMMLLTALSAH